VDVSFCYSVEKEIAMSAWMWGIGLLLMGVAIGSSAKRVAEDFQNVLRVMRKSSAPFLTP
jgi:hypothetical protein